MKGEHYRFHSITSSAVRLSFPDETCNNLETIQHIIADCVPTKELFAYKAEAGNIYQPFPANYPFGSTYPVEKGRGIEPNFQTATSRQ